MFGDMVGCSYVLELVIRGSFELVLLVYKSRVDITKMRMLLALFRRSHSGEQGCISHRERLEWLSNLCLDLDQSELVRAIISSFVWSRDAQCVLAQS